MKRPALSMSMLLLGATLIASLLLGGCATMGNKGPSETTINLYNGETKEVYMTIDVPFNADLSLNTWEIQSALPVGITETYGIFVITFTNPEVPCEGYTILMYVEANGYELPIWVAQLNGDDPNDDTMCLYDGWFNGSDTITWQKTSAEKGQELIDHFIMTREGHQI